MKFVRHSQSEPFLVHYVMGVVMKEMSQQGFKVQKIIKKDEDRMKKNQFHFFYNLSFSFALSPADFRTTELSTVSRYWISSWLNGWSLRRHQIHVRFGSKYFLLVVVFFSLFYLCFSLCVCLSF